MYIRYKRHKILWPYETIITQMYTVHFPEPSELGGVGWEIPPPPDFVQNISKTFNSDGS